MNQAIKECIIFIENILRSNEEKQQAIYYTLKLEKYGETTLLVERGKGASEFTKDIENCIKTHKPDQIIIELFKNKSHKIKTPISTYTLRNDKNSISNDTYSKNNLSINDTHSNQLKGIQGYKSG